MKFIVGVDGADFYWRPETKEVLRDEGSVYRVIGYADSDEEAKEVVIAWLP